MKVVLDLVHDDCRYPMRTRWKDMMTFCGRKVTREHSSYCERHHVICYPVAKYVRRPFKTIKGGLR